MGHRRIVENPQPEGGGPLSREQTLEAILSAAEFGEQPSVDLHGMNAQEAREFLERFLYDQSTRGVEVVRIVHGRGTGTLRDVTHALLRSHPLVEYFRDSRRADQAGGAILVVLTKKK